MVEIAPEEFTFQEPEDNSSEAAQQALAQAQEEIKTMEELNFTNTFVEDVFLEANQSYQLEDYPNVFKLTQLIGFIKKEKIDFLDQLELVRRKADELEKEGINVSQGKALIEEAMAAFRQDQLEDSTLFMEEADAELEMAREEHSHLEGLVELGKSFFLKHWWKIILIILIIGLITYLTAKKLRRKRLQTKLTRLKTELEKTQELIKRLQKNCFIEKKITTKTYKNKAAKYEERIAEIKHTLPVLEAQLEGKKAPEKKEKPKGILEVKK